jgi:hypothetical protein
VVAGDGRSSSRRTRRREEFKDYSVVDPKDIGGGPDVLIDIPVVKVDDVDVEAKRSAMLAKAPARRSVM